MRGWSSICSSEGSRAGGRTLSLRGMLRSKMRQVSLPATPEAERPAPSKKSYFLWASSVVFGMATSIGSIVRELSFGWPVFVLAVAIVIVVPLSLTPSIKTRRWPNLAVIALGAVAVGVADWAWKQPDYTAELAAAVLILGGGGTAGLLFGTLGLLGLWEAPNRERGA